MANHVSQKEIHNIVWNACGTFRGVIDPGQDKDYILTMLFLKYVSDVHKDIYDGYMKKYNKDKERVARAMKHERFVVPEDSARLTTSSNVEMSLISAN